MINISELSISDWVKILPVTENLKEYNTQIKQLTYEEVHDSFYVEDKDNYVILKYVEPIPLTPEILKQNGFILDDEIDEWYLQDGVCTTFEIQEYEAPYVFGDFALIRYVHELQHALRLCRLTEIADNFKV